MRCPRCQADVPDQATVCPSCGSSPTPRTTDTPAPDHAASEHTLLKDPGATMLGDSRTRGTTRPAGEQPSHGQDATFLSPAPSRAGAAPPFSSSGSFAAARLLGSRYRIDQLLGAGGMGAVYMLMGDAVDPRRRFIQTHARSVRNLDI